MHSMAQPVAALVLMVGSCSFGMRGVDPDWDGKQQPDCTDTYVPVLVDGFVATIVSSATAEVARTAPIDGRLIAASIAISLVYSASALVGSRRYRSCRTLRAEWHVREAISAKNNQVDSKTRAGHPSRPTLPTTSRASSNSQTEAMSSHRPTRADGFEQYFCTKSRSQSDLDVCLRGRSACEEARRAVLVPDSEECKPYGAVWCFDTAGEPICFTAQSTCEVRLARATGASGPCTMRIETRR
jgi:hypothetical protein